MRARILVPILLVLSVPATVIAAWPQGRGGAPGDRAKPAKTDKEKPEDDLSEVYFNTADWDADGWIRFSEAEKSLNVDQAQFALFDKDRDGGITAAEFAARYRLLVEKGGVFPAPRPKPDAPRAAKRDAKALLLAYDADLDAMLVESELIRALDEARVTEPTASVVLTTLDKDHSAGIDGTELDALSEVLYPGSGPKRALKPLTLEELFDHSTTSESRAGATMGPRRTVGPIPVFKRLDYDRSGSIDLYDLESLLRPMRSAVRPSAVLATLDTDGDGAISELEFAAAMR